MANVHDPGPPSVAAVAVGTAIISALFGYYIGQARSIGLFGGAASSHAKPTPGHQQQDDESDISDADSESGDVQDIGELQAFPDSSEECKLVLVVRNDLGMGKGECWIGVPFLLRISYLEFGVREAIGYCYRTRCPSCTQTAQPLTNVLIPMIGKIAAQCGHATLACYKTLLRSDRAQSILKQWERLGQAKVALKVDNEEDMLTLQAQAVSLGLCAQVIHDAGRTQIASGSATVLGIGPAPKSKVDEVTGHLKLL